MKGCRYRNGVSLLCAALGMNMMLGTGSAHAAVEVTVPADFQILQMAEPALNAFRGHCEFFPDFNWYCFMV